MLPEMVSLCRLEAFTIILCVWGWVNSLKVKVNGPVALVYTQIGVYCGEREKKQMIRCDVT